MEPPLRNTNILGLYIFLFFLLPHVASLGQQCGFKDLRVHTSIEDNDSYEEAIHQWIVDHPGDRS